MAEAAKGVAKGAEGAAKGAEAGAAAGAASDAALAAGEAGSAAFAGGSLEAVQAGALEGGIAGGAEAGIASGLDPAFVAAGQAGAEGFAGGGAAAAEAGAAEAGAAGAVGEGAAIGAGELGAGIGSIGEIGLEGGGLGAEAAGVSGAEAIAAPEIGAAAPGAAAAPATGSLGGFVAPETALGGEASGIGALTSPATFGSAETGLGGLATGGLGEEFGGAGLVGDVSGGVGAGGAGTGIGDAGAAFGGSSGFGAEAGGAGLVSDVTGAAAAPEAAGAGLEAGAAAPAEAVGDITAGAVPADVNAQFALSPTASDAIGAGPQFAEAGTTATDALSPVGAGSFEGPVESSVFDLGAQPIDLTDELQVTPTGNIGTIPQPQALNPQGITFQTETGLDIAPGATGQIAPQGFGPTVASPTGAGVPDLSAFTSPVATPTPPPTAAPAGPTAIAGGPAAGGAPAAAAAPAATGVPGLASPMGGAAAAGAAAAGVAEGVSGGAPGQGTVGQVSGPTVSPATNSVINQNTGNIEQVAQQHGWSNVPGATFTPENIGKLVQQESGGKNLPPNRYGYAGYFQMKPGEFGFTAQQFAQMSFSQQLSVYANQYLPKYGYNGTQDLGVMNAAPKYANAPDSTVAYRAGTAAANANPQWVKFSNANGNVTVGGIKAWLAAGGSIQPTAVAQTGAPSAGSTPAAQAGSETTADTMDILLQGKQINPQGLSGTTTAAETLPRTAATAPTSPLETTEPASGGGIGSDFAPAPSQVSPAPTGAVTTSGLQDALNAGGGVGGEINAPLSQGASDAFMAAPGQDVFGFMPGQVDEALTGQPLGFGDIGPGQFPAPTTPVDSAFLGPAEGMTPAAPAPSAEIPQPYGDFSDVALPQFSPPDQIAAAPPETPATTATPTPEPSPAVQAPTEAPAETPATTAAGENVPLPEPRPAGAPVASQGFMDWWKGLNPFLRAAITSTPSLLMSAYRLSQAKKSEEELQPALHDLEQQAALAQATANAEMSMFTSGQIPPDQEAVIDKWLRDMNNQINQTFATRGAFQSTERLKELSVAKQQADLKRASVLQSEFNAAQAASGIAGQDLANAARIQQANETNFQNSLNSLFVGLGGIAVKGALSAVA